MKTILYLQMTAMILTATFASDVMAQTPLPFHGSIQAIEAHDVQFPIIFANGNGTGNATHLGRFTMHFDLVVNLLLGTGIGPAHFTAANGDTIFTDVDGYGIPQENPDLVLVRETYTITGGTGRFAGATGSFNLERLADLVSGFSSGSFDGTIVLSKAK